MLAALGPRFRENERKNLVEHSSYDRVDMNARAVNHWKAGIALREYH